MKKKDYKAVKVIQPMTFDNVTYARDELKKCDSKLKLGVVLTLCAVPYTLFILLMMILKARIDSNPIIDFIGIVFLVIALGATLIGVVMIHVGGVAFRFAKKVTYWCWTLVPIFPIDLCVAFIGGAMALFSVLAMPALYLALGTYAVYREKCDAEAFLALMMATPAPKQQS